MSRPTTFFVPGGLATVVMPGLVPGIHVLCAARAKQNVDGRDIGAKQSFVASPGHDECECNLSAQLNTSSPVMAGFYWCPLRHTRNQNVEFGETR
jgi:hypothetical protein